MRWKANLLTFLVSCFFVFVFVWVELCLALEGTLAVILVSDSFISTDFSRSLVDFHTHAILYEGRLIKSWNILLCASLRCLLRRVIRPARTW